jgi:hypothetical protein
VISATTQLECSPVVASRPLGTSSAATRAPCADFPARLSLESGSEESVDDDRGVAVEGVNDLHGVDRGLSLGDGIRRFCGTWLPHFDDRDLDPRAGQSAGDYPAVTAVVSRTREHDGTRLKLFRITPGDLIRGCDASALHQQARRGSSFNGCPIALR